MKHKPDEENFDEAEAQAWRVWSEPTVPGEITSLFTLPPLSASGPTPNPSFHALLRTLNAFVGSPGGPGCLPLSAALPDMRTDTESYVKLQNLYRERSLHEKVYSKPSSRKRRL